jgi:hypothetical protein
MAKKLSVAKTLISWAGIMSLYDYYVCQVVPKNYHFKKCKK